MRRKRKPWQEKLDSFAMVYLEASRQSAALNFPEGDLKDVFVWFESHQKELLAAQQKFPGLPENEQMQTVELKEDFVNFLESVEPLRSFGLKAGENKALPVLAEAFSTAQKLYGMFEEQRGNRALAYVGLALAYEVSRRPVERFRKSQFGPEPLDWEKKKLLAAMCLEFVAGLLRGRLEIPKGRVNQQMIDYINFIQEHETEPLTDRDLHDVLAHARFEVPSEEHTWAVWLNRARKRGLIAKPPRLPKP